MISISNLDLKIEDVPSEFTISTNSKQICLTDLFIALAGENHDAFKFAEGALKSGAWGVVYNQNKENENIALELRAIFPQKTIISCKDTTKLLQEVSRNYLNEWRKNKLVIGITGSNGKTTHKNMLFDLLNGIYPGEVYCTQGNFNNHIGLPLSILNLKEIHKIVILEMGSNHPGEIKILCNMANPDAGIITSIGDSHREFFKTRKDVFKEKRELFDSVMSRNKNGFFIRNIDDVYLRKLPQSKNLINFSNSNSDFKYRVENDSLIIKSDEKTYTTKGLNIFGNHNYSNLTACILLAIHLFPEDVTGILSAASSITASKNRSQLITLNGVEIFLDAYNANPSSMEAALSSYFHYLKKNSLDFTKTVFIVGDMNELGEFAEEGHVKIGEYLKSNGAQNIYFIGQYAHFYQQGFGAECKCFASILEFTDSWTNLLNTSSRVFIKGSRSLQLESLTDIK
jgi:UDP-N-acetylmuramoyl-tripeptide--D-alanyl-D-alanine ligase